MQRLALLAVRLVALSYGRVVHDFPLVAAFLLHRVDKPSHEVVLVPPRHGDEYSAARRKSGVRRGSVPVPHGFPYCRRIGALPVLERVVDTQYVGAHASDAAFHAHAAERPFEPRHLEELHRLDVRLATLDETDLFGPLREAGVRENLAVDVALDDVLYVLVETLREASGIARGNYRRVRVNAETPRREMAAHKLALAVPRRHRDDKARRLLPLDLDEEAHELSAYLAVHPADVV